MIVYQKQPDGGWKRSGERLPTEEFVTIARNAEPHGKVALPFDEAIRRVENRISMCWSEDWRFEIAGASRLSKKGKF
jgi:hypothetical protein